MQMACHLGLHLIKSITRRKNPHVFAAARRFHALKRQKPKRKKSQNQYLKTEMQMARLLAHQSISPPSSHNAQHAQQPGTRTHIRLDILVGAGIQQQPRAGRVTTVTGHNQRRPSVLRAPPPPTCARRHVCVRDRRQPPPQPPPCTETTRRMRVNETISSQRKTLRTKSMRGIFKNKLSTEK